tara:strand:- start:585 stop:953 length:369 start_codon:yes stop_codon:yes gene_type:complete
MNNKLKAYMQAAETLLAGQSYQIICDLNPDDSVTFRQFGNGITPPSQSALDAKAIEIDNGYPMEELRKERNKLLAESDWMAVSDRTATDEQKAYRQTLRDLPSNQTPSDIKLSNITWPTKPS